MVHPPVGVGQYGVMLGAVVNYDSSDWFCEYERFTGRVCVGVWVSGVPECSVCTVTLVGQWDGVVLVSVSDLSVWRRPPAPSHLASQTQHFTVRQSKH